MKKLLKIQLGVIVTWTALVVPTQAHAQAVPSEYWENGIRYLVLTNTGPYALKCSILDSAGYWFTAVIMPTQRMWKPVHPSNMAQWECAPV